MLCSGAAVHDHWAGVLPDLHSSGCPPNPTVIVIYEASCSEGSLSLAQVPMDVTDGHNTCSSWQEGLYGLRLQEQ